MKIAFIHNLPSGGAKRAAYEFVKSLKINHTVDLFYIDKNSENYLDLRPLVDKTFYFNGTIKNKFLSAFFSLIKANYVYKKIANKINNEGYDIAFVNPCKLTIAPYVLNHLKVPSLYFCQEPLSRALEHYNKKSSLLEFLKYIKLIFKIKLDKKNALNATLICANSLYSVENIYRFYGRYPSFCPLGVDTNRFINKNLKKSIEILCVGALFVEKGQDFLIKSVAKLENRPPIKFISNFHDKKFKAKLIQLANSLNVKVSFELLSSDDDLIDAYNMSKVVVFPSRLEPFGLVPVEAMSCGTPVVAVAEGGVRETVVHKKTGLLSQRDIEEFSLNLKLILDNIVLRNKLSSNCRSYIEKKWSLENSRINLEKYLKKTIDIAQNNF